MCTSITCKLKNKFNKPKFAYLSVLGGFLIQITLGSVYTYGNMGPYMVAYMNNQSIPPYPIDAGKAEWIFGLSVFGLGASMPFVGFVVPRIGKALTLLLGGWSMSLGIIVTYWTIQCHLALVSLSYGLIVGLGVGLAYGTAVSIPSEWFPKSKGFTTGIVLAGFGFSPVTLDFIQSLYINPNITDVVTKDTSRVPTSFLIMGAVYAVIQLISSLIVKRPKERFSDSEDNLDSMNSPSISILAADDNEVNLKPEQLFLEKDFWFLWMTYTFNSVVAVLILSLHKFYGKSFRMGDLFLTIGSALGAFCNGSGRIIWGYLIDRISYKKVMSILTLCMAVMIGTFCLCILVDEKSKSLYIMYLIWVLVLHFLLSGNFTIFPVECSKRFGSEHCLVNYGILFTAYALAGIITSSTTTVILYPDATKYGYIAPFSVGCGLSLLSTLVTQLYRGKSNRRRYINADT